MSTYDLHITWLEFGAVKKSLTIVLPIHNGESQLHAQVEELLDLAIELTDNFRIQIVDDGSTDDTFEVASDLAVRFPQVSLTRQATQRGLGTTIESMRKKVKSDVVVVHDGVTPIDANQVRRLWNQCQNTATGMEEMPKVADEISVRDLADVAKTHAALEAVHRRMTGFQLFPSLAQSQTEMQSEMTADRSKESELEMPTSKSQQGKRDRSDAPVGSIPPLPRPNFLQAISQFALGE